MSDKENGSISDNLGSQEGASKKMQQMGRNAAGKVANKASQNVKKKIANKIFKKGVQSAATHSIGAALAPIIATVAGIIVFLIIIIGIIMFFVTMPGMVMGKLKAIFKEIGNAIAVMFGADTTAQIDDIEMYETLDYLEEMGWDLKGEGFLTGYASSEDLEKVKNDTNIDEERRNGAKLDDKIGVVRDADDKILYADTNFIFAYMMSDNYCFTLKNENLATQEKAKGFWGAVKGAITSVVVRFKDVLFGPLVTLFIGNDINNAAVEKFGKGLICLYRDSSLGVKGNAVDMSSIWDWDSFKVDTSNKTLSITRRALLNNNNPIEFSLDGWTGRYGMPLEFLLAVHKATLMPDLAFDMVTSFPTQVDVYLHDVSGEAIAGYKTKDGKYITLKELNNAFSGLDGSNFFSGIITWFDNLTTTEKEAQLAFQMGIEHHPKCECKRGKAAWYTYGEYNLVGDPESGFIQIKKGDATADLSMNDEGKYVTTLALHDANDNIENVKIAFSPDEVTKTETETETVTKVCGYCKGYITNLVKYCQDTNDFHLLAYSPYVAKVKNHWYRDVAFVLDSKDTKKFVDYDYDYEAITKERWTLYETDAKTGEFLYYEIDKDGNFVDTTKSYTKEDADKAGISVSKKAKTIDLSEQAVRDDLGWNEVSDNVWTAYKVNNEDTPTGYQPAYTQKDIDEEKDDSKKIILSNVYVNLSTSGNVVQTGEGMRYETNPKIKKMFLNNTYFRYDGSEQIAEAITQLRKAHPDEIGYGAISSEVLANSDMKTTVDGTEYKISDLTGKVSLNQDSLNAFSMLENEHTLDADYIYRDFKELVVELGYFEKEELTDETPRVLQFIVPDIGSGGYPDRSIDKNENELGTMTHSKGDIEVNKNLIIQAIYQKAKEEIENGTRDEHIESGVAGIKNNKSNDLNSTVKSIELTSKFADNQKINQIVRGMGSDYERIPEKGDGYEFKVKHGSAEFIHYYQFQGSYAEQTFTWAGKTCTLHAAACGPTSCVNLLTGYGQDVNPTKDIVGINFAADINAIKTFMEEHDVTGESYSGLSDSDYVTKIKEAFSENRPIITLMHEDKTNDDFWTSGGHFVAMIGMDNNGNIITLDSGTSNSDRHTYTGGIEGLMSTLDAVWIADEAPDGSAANAKAYEGYEGNEAVVSPVTGILLDYGTYDPVNGDVDSISGYTYRVNTDLRYGTNTSGEETNTSGEETDTSGEETNASSEETNAEESSSKEGVIQSDAVGFAKILVLDDTYYQKFEADISNVVRTFADKQSLLTTKGNYRDYNQVMDKELDEEAIENWNLADYTLYAYKEFAESYKVAGISGNIIYIDGFVPELPDTTLSGEDSKESESSSESTETSSKISEKDPNGEAINKDEYFTKINSSNIESQEQLETRYEKDDEYKMASEIATNRLNTETLIKDSAATAYTFDSDGKKVTILKEGTVIGRTMTDKELIVDIREETEEKYKEYRPDNQSESNSIEDSINNEGPQSKVMGNYLRIYMNNADDEVVENIEDYMKLDDLSDKDRLEVDWEFYYWLPYESGAMGELEAGRRTGAAACGTVSGADEIAVGIAQWTSLKKEGGTNNIPTICKWLAEEDSQQCGGLATFASWSGAQCCDSLSTLQTAWWSAYDTDPENFLKLQMKYFYETQFKSWIEDDGVSWLEDKSLVAQGTYASLKNWCPSPKERKWKDIINESMSDEEICKTLLTRALTIGSTVGTLGDRWNSQYVLAADIISGEFTELEEWIKTKSPEKYGEKKNPGVLGLLNMTNNYRLAVCRLGESY